MDRPKVVDDDRNTISVLLGEQELQSWFYGDEPDRREKMRHAWYFCDGFLAGQGARKISGDEFAERLREAAQ